MPELHIFSEPQEGATYGELARLAHATEAAGFAGFFRSDHFMTIDREGGLPGPTDSWVTLAGLAVETERIRLGTLMTSATFRLPGPLAIAVAEVDQISQGRLDLGIGAGWYAAEHRAYGIPFPDAASRFERLEEQLTILTGLWATPLGATFSFAGRHYQLDESPALPKPFQRPGPPILMGGMGKLRTPALAARFADEFNVPFVSLSAAAAQFEVVRQACRLQGRDPEQIRFSAALTVCCGRDQAEVRHRAGAIGQDLDQLGEIGAAGTPAQVIQRIAEYGSLGCDRIYLQYLHPADLDHLELLASEVLPAFA